MLTAIEHLVGQGFAVIWLRTKTKKPFEDDWTTRPVASWADLRATYRDGHNAGVRLGEPSKVGGLYLHVLDFDVRDPNHLVEALAALKRFLKDHTAYPTVISGSGGASRHFYFLSERPFRGKKLARSDVKITGADGKEHWAWEIDLFGTGKQVVLPPSVHPDTGKPYVWERPFDFDLVEMGLGPVIPSATVEKWGADLARLAPNLSDDEDLLAYVRRQPLGLKEGEVKQILKDLPHNDWCEDRDGWLQVGMALHHEFEGKERGFELWCEFSKASPKFNAKDQKRVWRSFDGKAKPVRMATLVKAAADARFAKQYAGDGFDDDKIETSGEDDLLADDDDDEDPAGDDDLNETHKVETDWLSLLDRNEEGAVKPTLHNVALLIEHDVRTAGVARLNAFTGEVVKRNVPERLTRARRRAKPALQLDGPVWDLNDPVNGDLWSDSMDNAVRRMIEAPVTQGGYGLKITDRDLGAAVDLAAHRAQFHPIREYLEGQTHDGTPRVETLFIDYLEADDTPYTRQVARMFLIAAVARVYEPGHKFDFAPILEGLQGKRKSTFIQVLGRHWFAELDGDFHDSKQMVELMQGSWIMEIPELSGFGRADVRTIKAFVSRQQDKTRLAYAHRAAVFKRQCVFIGSTNDRQYLKDDTGGRRWWPIECRASEIDTDQLTENVDQIWAEATAMYREMRAARPRGTLPLYLSDSAAKIEALRIQEDRRVEDEVDALVGRLEAWLDKPIVAFDDEDEDLHERAPQLRQTTCLIELWIECLGNNQSAYNRSASAMMGQAMRKVPGWVSDDRGNTERYGQQRLYRRVRRG